jgi:tRNA (guanosine-2'-O-)-methyltransferase
MRQATARRKTRIRSVLEKRQPDLTLVMDNIHDPHNVSAVLRSCDAFGVLRVHLYYTRESFPALGRKSSASANKWVEREHHSDGQQLAQRLRGEGLRVLGTGFPPRAKPLPDWDLTGPTAVVLGNEHRGTSPDLEPYLDGELYIPMQGMIESFNVSVAAGVILYEAWRQRAARGMFDRPSLDPDELEELYRQWCRR